MSRIRAFLAATLAIAGASQLSCSGANGSNCSIMLVHAGNAIEVGGEPRALVFARGSAQLRVQAVRLVDLVVAPVPATLVGDADVPWEVREQNGTVLGRVLPIAFNVPGQPGDVTLDFLDLMDQASRLAATPSDAKGAARYAASVSRMQEAVPALRTLVRQARGDEVQIGSAPGTTMSLDENGLKVLDRLIYAASEEIVPLQCGAKPTSSTSSALTPGATDGGVDASAVLARAGRAVIIVSAASATLSSADSVAGKLLLLGPHSVLLLGAQNLVLHMASAAAPVLPSNASSTETEEATQLTSTVQSVQEGFGGLQEAAQKSADSVSSWTSSASLAPVAFRLSAATRDYFGSAPPLCSDPACCGGQFCAPGQTCQSGTCVTCGQVIYATTGAVQTVTQKLKSGNESFQLTYDTYTAPDRIQVAYQGQTIFDTGCVATAGTQMLHVSGQSTDLTFTVTDCTPGGTGSGWEFHVCE